MSTYTIHYPLIQFDHVFSFSNYCYIRYISFVVTDDYFFTTYIYIYTSRNEMKTAIKFINVIIYLHIYIYIYIYIYI